MVMCGVPDISIKYVTTLIRRGSTPPASPSRPRPTISSSRRSSSSLGATRPCRPTRRYTSASTSPHVYQQVRQELQDPHAPHGRRLLQPEEGGQVLDLWENESCDIFDWYIWQHAHTISTRSPNLIKLAHWLSTFSQIKEVSVYRAYCLQWQCRYTVKVSL